MKTNERLIDLVKKVKGGNNAAFTDLYNESYQYLHTCVIHIVKDENVAQDMLQDAYVEIYKNIGQLKDDAGFLGWASTIANRKCFAYLKKNKDLLVDEQTDDEGNETDYFDVIADDEAFIPENILDNQEKIKIIRGIIDDLTDVQRACVIGFYYNEQKQDEIANELGLPVNTVKSHLNRAKAKIKEAVGDTERKQGIKLYSIAPFMLLFFLKDTEVYAAELSVPAMSAGLSSAVSGSTVTSGTVAAGAKAVGMAIKTKVIAGIVAGAVVVGGITGVALHKEKPAEIEVIEAVDEPVVEEIVETPEVEEVAENYVDVTINLDDMLNQIVINGTSLADVTYDEYVEMAGGLHKEGDWESAGMYDDGVGVQWGPESLFVEYNGGGDNSIQDLFNKGTRTFKSFINEYEPTLFDKSLEYGTVKFNNGQLAFFVYENKACQWYISLYEADAKGLYRAFFNTKEDGKVYFYGFDYNEIPCEGKPLAEYEEQYGKIPGLDIDTSDSETVVTDNEAFVDNHDIQYTTNTSFTLPYLIDFTDADGNVVKKQDFKLISGESQLTITGATLTDSSEEGYVDLELSADTTINPRMLQMTWDAQEDHKFNMTIASIGTEFDKYTGAKYP